MKTLAISLAVLVLALCVTIDVTAQPEESSPREHKSMELGAFSVSLAVKDLQKSRAFYEQLGFEVVAGKAAQNWLILKNGDHAIGLFQGMFERNLLTFNPGWTQDQGHLEEFQDVREIQRALEGRGIELTARADESSTGPASLMLLDPDGNPILIDQHVSRPGK